jgi:hypothetical protein
MNGVNHIDTVLGPSSFFAYLLIVLILVGIKESIEVGRNPYGCSRFHWPIAATTCAFNIDDMLCHV